MALNWVQRRYPQPGSGTVWYQMLSSSSSQMNTGLAKKPAQSIEEADPSPSRRHTVFKEHVLDPRGPRLPTSH
ncbi:hypothetical protein VTK73DRAFT_3483 [Phialemonium thermophilum]|uniref:Uncharacterized protein n=1 Tax=Phialemonium thermophilum TaxID=223376 RepID=A0ABR3VIE3_9PEZI